MTVRCRKRGYDSKRVAKEACRRIQSQAGGGGRVWFYRCRWCGGKWHWSSEPRRRAA